MLLNSRYNKIRYAGCRKNQSVERMTVNHDVTGSDFYFTTNTSSMRVAQYRQNPQACIYFYDRRFFRGVMLQGYDEGTRG